MIVQNRESNQCVKIGVPVLPCDPHFVLMHKYQHKLSTNPSLDLSLSSRCQNCSIGIALWPAFLCSCTNIKTNCLQTQVWIYVVSGMTNVQFHTLPLVLHIIILRSIIHNNIPFIVFTLKPTSLTSLLTNIHLMKHNKRQYKPHLKWGDLYIRLNPSVDYLRGPPYFGSRREYQFIALISLVDAFYSDIEVEIEIRPDPLPHVASFLSLVRRPFQGSGIHLTLAECFHLNRFVDYIIIRGTLEPVKNPGWIWYPNSLANMRHRKSSSRVLEKI